MAGDWWHPKWWNADTKSGQAITLKNMEQVGSNLSDVLTDFSDCSVILRAMYLFALC